MLDRKPRKRGGTAGKRGLPMGPVPVLVARDCSGGAADFILAADGKANIVAAVKPILGSDAILCADGDSVLAAAANIGVTHRPVNV